MLQTFVEGEGVPMVMLGGGTDGAAAFAPHAQMLAKEFRVVRVQSVRIQQVQSQQPLPPGYSIKTESTALAGALDRLGISEPVCLVGHSFGALVALDFALDRPDRVRVLVLVEPPAFWAVPAEELRADAGMSGMVALSRTLEPTAQITDEQYAEFLSRLGRPAAPAPAEGQPGWDDWAKKRSSLRGLSAVANHTDDPLRLRSFRKPVLIVTGRDTVAFHRRINEVLAANFPVVQRLELPGGHRAPSAPPEEFVLALTEFAVRHTRPTGAGGGRG